MSSSNSTKKPIALLTLATFGLVSEISLSSAATADGLVKPLEVRTVYANGKHNAFTAMRRFQGDLWLAFRCGDAHNSATAA